ncbi:signal peptide-containing protein [Theileria equi strain WA]|uniref:Signal peptide-containing protein n=1 Tax=Theileria equi strain WA TaxID=1537102 RepID=L0B041_THEEQ|nr:signal peptide-containing protein [Theileria equi strain WA]AFZ80626.1 signal peptide-containing protein [Theileria equi strain WA]|eukprot:XP_004830292.1 signal peptide-containing protein [Theileria equi strain WA]
MKVPSVSFCFPLLALLLTGATTSAFEMKNIIDINADNEVTDYPNYFEDFTVKKFLDRNQPLLTENTLFISFLTASNT